MDYSKLIEAIAQDDKSTINALLEQMTPHLIRYLQTHMNASRQDAEDCVQQTLIKLLVIIREEKLRNEDHLLSFVLTVCRNTYLNLVKEDDTYSYDELYVKQSYKPEQLMRIMDRERRQALEWCIRQLPDHYREFIRYWFEHPDSSSRAAATRFNMSVNNVWTRKHRIIKRLRDCFQKKNNI